MNFPSNKLCKFNTWQTCLTADAPPPPEAVISPKCNRTPRVPEGQPRILDAINMVADPKSPPRSKSFSHDFKSEHLSGMLIGGIVPGAKALAGHAGTDRCIQ
jgi:hypothetical protein